jgi:hypothetical protein
MAKVSANMKLSQLSHVFYHFNQAVKRKDSGWVKMEYSDWQKLNRFFTREYCKDTEDEISIEIGNDNCSLFNTETNTLCNLPYKSHQFFDFLLQEIKSKERTMTTFNTTTSQNITVNGSNASNCYTTTNVDTGYNYDTYTVHTTPSYQTWTNIPTDIKDLNGVTITKDGIYINGKKVLTEDDEKMNTKDLNMNFDFGPVKDRAVAVSPFGVAIKNLNSDGYCYYNPDTCEIVDCTPFTFDTSKFLYKMPVAVSAIAVGDVIVHRGHPMFVKGYEDEEGRICVIDVAAAEEKFILPVKNMFGFNFVTKIVSLLDMKNNGASAETPFGNMLPFLMLMNDKDLDPMMLLMMNGGQIGGLEMNTFTKNPLMMYMIMKDNKDLKDMLPFLMMTSATPVQR